MNATTRTLCLISKCQHIPVEVMRAIVRGFLAIAANVGSVSQLADDRESVCCLLLVMKQCLPS